MADISKIQVPDGTSYDIISKTGRGLVRATMDSTSTSTAFLINTDSVIDILYDGLTIVCKNTKVASAANCTLQLNNTGAKRIWLSQGNAYCTTHWGLNQTYIFIYDATNERWELQQGRDTNSDTTTIKNTFIDIIKTKAGTYGVKKTSLVLIDGNGLLQSLTTTSGTGTTKAKNPSGFVLGQIYYANGSSDTAAGNIPGASAWNLYVQYSVDMRNSTNCGSTLVVGKFLYLVGTISSSDGLFYLDDTWWTQDLPTTADGKVYMYVGNVVSTTVCCLAPTHPSYEYKNGSIQLYCGNASTVNGHTVSADVPSDAVFTYTFTNGGTNKFTVTPSGGTAQDVTFTASDDTKVAKSGDTMTGNLTFAQGKGIKLKDSTSAEYAGIYDNNANLWIGATSAGGVHHKGGTYISAGLSSNGTSSNDSIYISKPTKSGSTYSATNYLVAHTGNVGTGDNNGQIKIAGANVSVKGLNDSAYKAVDTSISTASTSANLPTSAAVASFVEGKGYVTENNKVTQSATTTADWRKVVLGRQYGASGQAITETTDQVYVIPNFECQPSTGTVKMTKTMINNGVTLEYNTTTQSLDFIFS